MSHTPGPWTVSNDRIASTYGDIAAIHYQSSREQKGWDDRRLIAAAPDLLAALIRMRDEFSGAAQSKAQDDAWAMAQDAIEKAGGE